MTRAEPLLPVNDLMHGMASRTSCMVRRSTCARAKVVTPARPHGAGKTTTLKSIMGIVGQRKGSVRFEGRELIGLSSNAIARVRHRFLPGGTRHLCEPRCGGKSLSAARGEAGWIKTDSIFTLFPNIKERLRQPGHQAIRRRAADAGDRPHPAHRRAAAAAG
jgi:branched-chain amino acid transport system ATP-binding protein